MPVKTAFMDYLNFGLFACAPSAWALGRLQGLKKKIVFHCGGFAAAVKNVLFLFFSPCRKRVAEIFPPCHAKSQTSGLSIQPDIRARRDDNGCRGRQKGVWGRRLRRPQTPTLLLNPPVQNLTPGLSGPHTPDRPPAPSGSSPPSRAAPGPERPPPATPARPLRSVPPAAPGQRCWP